MTSPSTSTPEAILDAALEVFARDGMHGTRLEDVAAVAGVTRATLYYHFRSREALVSALTDRAVGRLADEVGRVVAEGSVRELTAAIVRTYAADHALYRLLLTEVWAPVGGRAAVERIEREVLGPITERLARAIEEGEVRSVDPRVAALALFGQASAVALGGIVQDEADVGEVERQLVRIVEGGLDAGAA